ncbi:MAG: hypothetical protein HGB03_02050 [Candidatus Yonathbacteria bacterium]|nr:hypothetical protein [Candidatus Yonathbacteria bacterium]NTW48037.1 hypothetical protein [Candidatus Yonathbacteria bacterium]
MQKIAYAGLGLSTILPALVFAQTTLVSILGVFKSVLDLLIPIVITLAVVIFFFGLAMYLLKADAEKDKGRTIMIYGIVTLFVMIAVWGLVEVLANTFRINTGGSVNLPTVPMNGSNN